MQREAFYLENISEWGRGREGYACMFHGISVLKKCPLLKKNKFDLSIHAMSTFAATFNTILKASQSDFLTKNRF